jgi:BNR/Asp-box repeat protein
MQRWLHVAMSQWTARGWGTRHALIAVAGVLLVAMLILPGTLRSSVHATPTPPTRQQIAQKILQSPAGQTLTTPARIALEMIARGDHRITPDSKGISLPKAKSGKGGHFTGGPGLTNIRVNDPAEDSHQVDQTTQSETSLAVSGSNIAVGFNDSQTTGLFLTAASNLSGVAFSRNGGQTFVDGGVLPNIPGDNNFGDPWLASDSAGNMYYSNLVLDVSRGSLFTGLARSTDGGQTWSTPVVIPPPAGVDAFGYSADKDAMTAGPGVGNLYDVWDDFTFTFDPNTGNVTVSSGLAVAHSTNGGQTWSTVYADQVPIFSDTDPCSFHQYIGAQPIVGPDGTVYDAAVRFDLNDPTCSGAPMTESEHIFASHDGGATFPQKVKIADVTPSTGAFFGAFTLGHAQFMRNLEFPTLAFLGNTLYATWNDGGDGSGHSHIRLAKSTDGGQTWTTSFVTSGTSDEAQPSITGDSSGLHILYYEITPVGDGTSMLDVLVSNSADGSSFGAKRITTQSFPGVFTFPQFDPIIAFTYMGDYIASASSGGHQFFAWGDNRDVVNSFLWPSGRHDPDVFFAKQ